jgi:hypothetical protein
MEMTFGMRHRFRRSVVGCTTAMVLITMAANAWSQTVRADEWRYGTTLGAFVGAASASTDTGAAVGATLGWEVTPHFTLEGRGVWFDGGQRADAFTALLGAHVPLLPARPVAPFVSAGAGVYHATFESMSSAMPRFYQRRMMSETAGFQNRTFNDFVVALGGGIDVFLARHLALRPEATVLLVTTRSDTRAVSVYGMHLAYHFESHPVTRARR